MRITLFLAILLASSILHAQDKPGSKISIGFNFSPDYSFRALNNATGEPPIDLVIKSRNSVEVGKFGFVTGLNLVFECSKWISLETGLQYSAKGYQTKTRSLVYAQPDPGAPTTAKFTYAYQYLGVPLKVKLSLGKNKVRFVTGIGFTTNLLLRAKQTIDLGYATGKTEERSQSSTSEFKKIDISPMVSLGIHYRCNDKTHFLAEPTFRYGMIATQEGPVNEHLWSAGVNFGFYRSLK